MTPETQIPVEQAPETLQVLGMTFRKKGAPQFDMGRASQEYEHGGVTITRTYLRFRSSLAWRALYTRGTNGVLPSLPASAPDVTSSPEEAFRSMMAAADRAFVDIQENHSRVATMLAASRMQVANLKALLEG